jgi:hypothetical protein
MWVIIMQENDFNIVHKVGRVNEDVNGLSQNPSSNEEDTILKLVGMVMRIWK